MCLLIHQLVEMCFFQFGVITNKAAITIDVEVFEWIYVFISLGQNT